MKQQRSRCQIYRHNRHYRHVKGVKREAKWSENPDFIGFLNEKPVFSLIGEGFKKRQQG